MIVDFPGDLTAIDVAVEMRDFGQAELLEVLAFVRCIRERDLPTVIDFDRRRAAQAAGSAIPSGDSLGRDSGPRLRAAPSE
jgi:hypothetical protein